MVSSDEAVPGISRGNAFSFEDAASPVVPADSVPTGEGIATSLPSEQDAVPGSVVPTFIPDDVAQNANIEEVETVQAVPNMPTESNGQAQYYSSTEPSEQPTNTNVTGAAGNTEAIEDSATSIPSAPPIPEEAQIPNIPDMPIGENPNEQVSSGHYIGLGDDESDYSSDSFGKINQKIQAKSYDLINWAKLRKSTLIKLVIVMVATIFMAIFACKQSIVPITSMLAQNFFTGVGLKDTSFSISYVDGRNIILSDIQTQDKNISAKEITVTYSLSDLFFKNTIQEIVVKDVVASVDVGKDSNIKQSLSAAFLNQPHRFKNILPPKYVVNSLRVTKGEAIFSGGVNGTATFSLSGFLNKQLSLKAPMFFDTNIIKGDVSFAIKGWGNSFDIGVDIDEINLNRSDDKNNQNQNALLSVHDAKISFMNGLFKQTSFTVAYTKNKYRANIISDIQYINDKLTMDVSLNSNVINDQSSINEQIGYNRLDNTKIITTNNIPPIGDIKISIKDASLDYERGFSGNLPMELSSEKFTWKDVTLANTKIDFKGKFACKDSVCNYTLNDESFVTLDKISFPVVKFGLEAVEKVHLSLAKLQQPILSISSKEIAFNAEFFNLSLGGSIASAQETTPFSLESKKLFAKGYANLDGSFNTDIDMSNFNLSMPSYLLKDAYAKVKLSSDSPLALNLQARQFAHKSASQLIIPSFVAMDAIPTDQENVYQFKLLLRQEEFGTSQVLSGVYDYYKGRVVANFVVPEIRFSQKLQPKQIFPLWGKDFTDIQGSVSVEGTINWNGVSVSGPARFTFKDFSARKGYATVSGLNSTFAVSNFNPITTVKPQNVKAKSLNVLLPFQDVSCKVGISSSGFTVYDFSASLAGGKVEALESLNIPYELNASPYMLLLSGGDFKHIPFSFNIPATMMGRFNARLPLMLRKTDAAIIFGDISSISSGFIKANVPTQYNVSEFDKITSNLSYSNITGSIDSSLRDSTSITLNVSGTNPLVNDGKPFKQTVKTKRKTSTLLK